LIAALLPALQPLIAPLSLITQSLGQSLLTAVVALTPAINTLAQVLTVMAPYLPTIAAGYIAIRGALIGMQVAQGVAASIRGVALATDASAAATRGFTVAAGLQKAATIASTAVQWLWNAALAANPIGLVVVAITALVGGLVWFFTQTKLGQQVWQTVWGG